MKRLVMVLIRLLALSVVAFALGVLTAGVARAAGRAPLVRAAAVPVTDGRGVATWVDHGRLAVLRDSQPLSKPVLFPRPKDCVFTDDPGIPQRYVVDGDRVAMLCQQTVEAQVDPAIFGVYNYVTGRVEIPPTDALTRFEVNGADPFTFYEVTGLGSQSIEIEGCFSHGCFSGIESIRTGQILDRRIIEADYGATPPAPRFARTVPSLDDPSGSVSLCAPLGISSHLEQGVGLGELLRIADYAIYRPPFLLTLRSGKAELHRCGSQRYETLGRATTIVLTGRYAAWTNGTRLTVVGLRHHTRFRYKLPATPYLVGTDCRLWVDAGRGPRVADYC